MFLPSKRSHRHPAMQRSQLSTTRSSSAHKVDCRCMRELHTGVLAVQPSLPHCSNRSSQLCYELHCLAQSTTTALATPASNPQPHCAGLAVTGIHLIDRFGGAHGGMVW